MVHLSVPLDFDTHDSQPRRLAANLAALDAALDAFGRDLAAMGVPSSNVLPGALRLSLWG